MLVAQSLTPGTVLGQRYRLEDTLGEGGVGTVFRATDLSLSREIAVKCMLPAMLGVAGSVERFEQEARLAQRLTHPNTVRVLDVGRDPRGLPFIVFELLRGRSLEELLATEGPLPAPRVRELATQVLKSLLEAHARGVVHRDIKPSNIWVCDESQGGLVKVLDFGIARVHDVGTSLATATGQVLGTPRYMAPEQVMSARVDASVDLYALGLVMAEALTGSPVFTETSAVRVCMEQVSERPVPLPPEVLASPLGPVIQRATYKSRDARYPSAAAMLEALSGPGPSLSPGGAIVITPQAIAPALLPPPGFQGAVGPTAPSPAAAPTVAGTAASPPASPPSLWHARPLWFLAAALFLAALALGGAAFWLFARGPGADDPSRPLSVDEDWFLEEGSIARHGPVVVSQCLAVLDWDTEDNLVVNTEDQSLGAVTVHRGKRSARVHVLQFGDRDVARDEADALRDNDEGEEGASRPRNVVYVAHWVFYSTGNAKVGRAALADLLACHD